jgi:hypothetical protein
MGMINSYLTDIINIVTVKVDKWNSTVETIGSDIKCRIKDTNKLVATVDGKEIRGNMLIFIGTDTTINHQDKIIIKKKHRIIYPYDNKKFQVQQINSYGMFKRKMTEILIGKSGSA